jgi:peptide/nickel transport system permease protein
VSASVLRQLWTNPPGRIGLLLVLLLLATAVMAPWLATHNPNTIDIRNRFAGPSLAHLMGTDHLGRDSFSRIVYGSRIAMLVAIAVIAIALAIGLLLGIAAAYLPHSGERLLLMVFDVIRSFPTLVLMLALVAILGPSLVNVIIIVTITFIPQFGRVTRAQVLAIKSAPFLEAERLLAAPRWRLVWHHLIPNVIGPVAVLASMDVPVVISAEAALSFLGLGVRPPLASWGTLLHDGYEYLGRSPWPVSFAGLALTAATLGFTLFGEALRDAVDPKLQRVR